MILCHQLSYGPEAEVWYLVLRYLCCTMSCSDGSHVWSFGVAEKWVEYPVDHAIDVEPHLERIRLQNGVQCHKMWSRRHRLVQYDLDQGGFVLWEILLHCFEGNLYNLKKDVKLFFCIGNLYKKLIY